MEITYIMDTSLIHIEFKIFSLYWAYTNNITNTNQQTFPFIFDYKLSNSESQSNELNITMLDWSIKINLHSNTASNEYSDTIASIEHDINNKNNDSIDHLIITDNDNNGTFQ